jgi:hypothetical protein
VLKLLDVLFQVCEHIIGPIVRVLWQADERPEAQRFSLGCGLVVLLGVALWAAVILIGRQR